MKRIVTFVLGYPEFSIKKLIKILRRYEDVKVLHLEMKCDGEKQEFSVIFTLEEEDD